MVYARFNDVCVIKAVKPGSHRPVTKKSLWVKRSSKNGYAPCHGNLFATWSPGPLLTFCAILNLEIPLKMLKRAGAGTHKYASGLRIYKVMLTTSHWESEVISLLEVPNYSTCIIWLCLHLILNAFWFLVHCFSCFFWLCVLLSVCNLLLDPTFLPLHGG